MKFENNTYISGDGVYYEGVIRDVKRSKISLQPVYEAFTNSLEAIRIKEELNKDFKGKIEIKIYSTTNSDIFFTKNQKIKNVIYLSKNYVSEFLKITTPPPEFAI